MRRSAKDSTEPKRMERYLVCEICGARKVLRFLLQVARRCDGMKVVRSVAAWIRRWAAKRAA
jgi:hypothetical protein